MSKSDKRTNKEESARKPELVLTNTYSFIIELEAKEKRLQDAQKLELEQRGQHVHMKVSQITR